MAVRKNEEPLVLVLEKARNEVTVATPVETDDRYYMPIRQFTNGYVNNKAVNAKVDLNNQLTLISDENYHLVRSDAPLEDHEEIVEKQTGNILVAAGKTSVVLQLVKFRRRTDILMVKAQDVDLTLGLICYERNKSFVLDTREETLKPDAECNSSSRVEVKRRARPGLQVRSGKETSKRGQMTMKQRNR